MVSLSKQTNYRVHFLVFDKLRLTATFMEQQKNNPLHGITLQSILEYLVELYGWEELAARVSINSFIKNPSINSSLKFLRTTPWARKKVEDFYLFTLREKRRNKDK